MHAPTDPPAAHCQVGAYYKGGLTAIDGVVVEGYDRAAPAGVGLTLTLSLALTLTLTLTLPLTLTLTLTSPHLTPTLGSWGG